MSKPRKNWCCGCPARAGTSILLWLTIIWCMVGMYVVNYQFENIFNFLKQWDTSIDWLLSSQFFRHFLLNLFCLVLVVCVMGLYGIITRNPHLLMPYIVYRIIVDVLIVVVLFPFTLHVYGPKLEKGFRNWMMQTVDSQDFFDHIFIFFIVAEFLFMGIEVRLFKVVLSCYHSMAESSKLQRNEILTLSGLRSSSPNDKFYWRPDYEITTAV